MKSAPKQFYIDTDRLNQRGACIWGRRKFERVFPQAANGKRVPFTYENWEKARKNNLSIGWLAIKVLGDDDYLAIEDSYYDKNRPASLYTLNGSFTKRYGDVLYKAIKKKLEAK